jgi:PAS domain-containing protein
MSPVDRKLPLFEDADETIQAIHQGDVDAVVVMRALEGPQVILLHGAEEPYRVLVERMSDGALTAGPDGIILYVNDRLCELTGYPSSRLVGRDISSLFEGEPPTLVPEVTAETSLLRNGDDAMPVAVWSRPISIANTTATLVRLTDLSIHRRAAAGWLHLFRSVSARNTQHGRGGNSGALLRREPRHHAGDQAVPWR